jgi:hypothetical protein
MFNFFKQKIRFAYRSPKWSTIRKKFISRNPICAACGSSKNLEVHHIKPVHLFPEKELDINNLITLCGDKCHILFGHCMDFKSWNPNVIEDCHRIRERIKNRP